MRHTRLKVPPDRPVGFYHCISRCVEGRFVFGDVESEHFLKLMREFEEFCEVRVLTFCLMSNHFHILLEVPKRPEILPSAEVILSKLEALTGFQDPGAARQELELYRATNDAEAEKAWLERYYRRKKPHRDCSAGPEICCVFVPAQDRDQDRIQSRAAWRAPEHRPFL